MLVMQMIHCKTVLASVSYKCSLHPKSSWREGTYVVSWEEQTSSFVTPPPSSLLQQKGLTPGSMAAVPRQVHKKLIGLYSNKKTVTEY